MVRVSESPLSAVEASRASWTSGPQAMRPCLRRIRRVVNMRGLRFRVRRFVGRSPSRTLAAGSESASASGL